MSSWKPDCFYHDIIRDMGATVDMCSLTIKDKNFDYEGCSNCNKYLKKDLVQVVRCKDCKHFRIGSIEDNGGCYCYPDGRNVSFNDFCSWGKRRDLSGLIDKRKLCNDITAYLDNYSEVLEIIDWQPVINTDNVKTGMWEGVNPMVDTLECSECGYQIISEDFMTPYCPNCGVKMINEDK